MSKFILFSLFAIFIPGAAFAYDWVPDGFVVWELKGVNRIGGVGPLVMPKDASDKLKEMQKFEDKIDELERQKFHLNQASADSDLSEAEQTKAGKNYQKTAEKVEALKEEKIKIFGPDAEKLRSKLFSKARWFGRQVEDIHFKDEQIKAKNRTDWGKLNPRDLSEPGKVFKDAQAAVTEAGDDFMASAKKVSVKGRAKGLRRAGAAAAAGAAVMVGVDVMMSDGAKADELKTEHFQQNDVDASEKPSDAEIGVLEDN